MGSKIYKKNPRRWATISGYWDEIYPTLEFEVNVEFKLSSVGDIANLKD